MYKSPEDLESATEWHLSGFDTVTTEVEFGAGRDSKLKGVAVSAKESCTEPRCSIYF